MAITAGYATQAELKTLLAVTKTAHDADMDRAIETASRSIDRYTRRRFWVDSTVQTRYYSPGEHRRLNTDDISTTTGLLVTTDIGTDGTFEQSWTLDDYSGSYGFAMSPANAAADSKPWTGLEALDGSWPKVRRSVKVIAKFGWAAVPKEVESACLLLALRYYKRKDSPFGVLDFPGSGVSNLPRTDPDLANQLQHLVVWQTVDAA